MATPSILARVLTTTNGLADPQRGQGLSNFVADLDAVALTISENIKLLQGEWWLNTADGLPLFQSILGVSNTSAGVGLIVRKRILTVPFVTDIQNLIVTYSDVTRAYTFSANVLTAFGTLQVTNQLLPGSSAVVTVG